MSAFAVFWIIATAVVLFSLVVPQGARASLIGYARNASGQLFTPPSNMSEEQKKAWEKKKQTLTGIIAAIGMWMFFLVILWLFKEEVPFWGWLTTSMKFFAALNLFLLAVAFAWWVGGGWAKLFAVLTGLVLVLVVIQGGITEIKKASVASSGPSTTSSTPAASAPSAPSHPLLSNQEVMISIPAEKCLSYAVANRPFDLRSRDVYRVRANQGNWYIREPGYPNRSLGESIRELEFCDASGEGAKVRFVPM